MADERDDIRSRISIVELVGQRVQLKRTGKNWKGLCPFHEDRNPSFTVSDSTGTYRCWACGEHGDVFTWVMKTQRMEFREALEFLARQAGVTLRRRGPSDSPSQKSLHLETMRKAQEFFARELGRSSLARAYLEGRGIEADVAADWEIGYAPDVDAALATQLQKDGVQLSEAQTLFLVEQDASGSYRDKFRGRLMFAIRDERRDLVAFGGRLLGDGHPKYINSGDTPLFRKSRLLYGLGRAIDAISGSRSAVLVEGYLDVIACHRAGVRTAVASLGTSLTEDHAKLLKRHAEEVTILFDADPAGQKAAERALDILSEAGLIAKVALMPPGSDPDALLRSDGASSVRTAAAEGLSALEFRIRAIEARMKPTDEAFWPEIATVLAGSANLTEWERHATQLAARHLPGQSPQNARTALLNEVRRARRRLAGTTKHRTSGSIRAPALPFAPAEAAVLRGFLEESTRARSWQAIHESELWTTPLAVEAARALVEAFPRDPPQGPPSAWLARIEPEELRLALADLEFVSTLFVTGEFLEGAIRTLERDREARSLTDFMTASSGEDRLREIQKRLEALKSVH